MNEYRAETIKKSYTTKPGKPGFFMHDYNQSKGQRIGLLKSCGIKNKGHPHKRRSLEWILKTVKFVPFGLQDSASE